MTQDDLNLVLDALKFCHGGEPCGTAEAIAVVEKALAQRTWVGLTDVEIDYPLGSTVGENEETHISFARAIESKLKELNT